MKQLILSFSVAFCLMATAAFAQAPTAVAADAKMAPSVEATKAGTLENTIYLDIPAGRVVIEMRPDLAPKHVARIKELTRKGFYDGLVFHRVIAGFMAQTGDPTGTGTSGSGKNIPAEFSAEPFVRGTMGMARSSDINSADSQFFIMFDDGSFLNNNYTVWGKVTSGMEFVDQIRKGEPPMNPDKIIKMQMAGDVSDKDSSKMVPMPPVEVKTPATATDKK
jgi:peptidylprolyl isomerase